MLGRVSRFPALASLALVLLASGGGSAAVAGFRGPNGLIAYMSRASGGASADIWVIRPDGTGAANLTNTPSEEDRYPEFSPNGRQIAFVSQSPGSDTALRVMDADGSNVRTISDPAGDALQHVFSYDDTLIAYQSNLDGDYDIYVYEFASEKTRLVTDNTIADYAPTWWCYGPTLLFTSDITEDSNIFETPALPIDAPAILVESQAVQLTNAEESDQYPQNTPSEENASREGQLPSPFKNK
jgi:Tol biopolymer transport system component